MEKNFTKDQIIIGINFLGFEIIQSIITQQKYNNYLEIGCDRNENFSKINIQNKVGVDPLRGGTLRMTSNDFFKIISKNLI